MDLGTFISVVALIAAAASLTWQRVATQDQRKARLEDEEERLARSRREATNLTTQTLALVMAGATKYARLESRIDRLLLTNLNPEDRQALTPHMSRVKNRLEGYNKRAEEVAASLNVLRQEAISNAKSTAHYEELSSALLKANTYAESTRTEESQAIEDEIKRLEQKVP